MTEPADTNAEAGWDERSGAQESPDLEAQESPPDPETRWVSTLRDSDAPGQHQDLFQAAYDSLTQQLELEPDTLDQLRRVIELRMRVAPPNRALGEVTDALKALLGLDVAYLLHWLTYEDPVLRLDRIQPSVPPEVHVFLREVVAEHVTTFDLIQRTAQSSPEDWFDIDARLSYNLTTQQYTVDVTLVKIDYSRVHLTMSASSTLALASQLLSVAAQVSDRGQLSDAVVERWYEATWAFQQLLQPTEEQGPPDEPGSMPAPV